MYSGSFVWNLHIYHLWTKCCFFQSDTFTCPILGPLLPLFYISGDVSSGLQRQSGFCLIRIGATSCWPLDGQHCWVLTRFIPYPRILLCGSSESRTRDQQIMSVNHSATKCYYLRQCFCPCLYVNSFAILSSVIHSYSVLTEITEKCLGQNDCHDC